MDTLHTHSAGGITRRSYHALHLAAGSAGRSGCLILRHPVRTLHTPRLGTTWRSCPRSGVVVAGSAGLLGMHARLVEPHVSRYQPPGGISSIAGPPFRRAGKLWGRNLGLHLSTSSGFRRPRQWSMVPSDKRSTSNGRPASRHGPVLQSKGVLLRRTQTWRPRVGHKPSVIFHGVSFCSYGYQRTQGASS